MNVKYPEIEVQLTGTDGNAFALIGQVSKALKRGGVDAGDVTAFTNEAMSAPSYDDLLSFLMQTVEVN